MKSEHLREIGTSVGAFLTPIRPVLRLLDGEHRSVELRSRLPDTDWVVDAALSGSADASRLPSQPAELLE